MLVVLFSILLYTVRPSEIIAACSHVRFRYLLFAFLIVLVKNVIQILRWDYLLGVLDPKPPLKDVIISMIGGFFLGAMSPSRTGELARGIWIPGHPLLRTVSLTLIEKGLNQFVVLFFGCVTLTVILPWHLKLFPLAGVIVLVAGIILIHRLNHVWNRVLNRFFSDETVDHVLTALTALSPERIVTALSLSVAVYLGYSAHFYCLLLGFSHITLTTALKTLPIIYFVDQLLPFSYGDFGVKELASVSVLGHYGISGGIALSAAFIQNVLSLLLPALIGGIIVLVLRFRRGTEVPPSSVRDTPS